MAKSYYILGSKESMQTHTYIGLYVFCLYEPGKERMISHLGNCWYSFGTRYGNPGACSRRIETRKHSQLEWSELNEAMDSTCKSSNWAIDSSEDANLKDILSGSLSEIEPKSVWSPP